MVLNNFIVGSSEHSSCLQCAPSLRGDHEGTPSEVYYILKDQPANQRSGVYGKFEQCYLELELMDWSMLACGRLRYVVECQV